MTLKFSGRAKAEDFDPNQIIQNGKNFLIFLVTFLAFFSYRIIIGYIYIYISFSFIGIFIIDINH